MNRKLSDEVITVLQTTNYLPSVSIIISFTPKITERAEMEHKLKLMMDHVEKELMKAYAAEKYKPVMVKLQTLVQNIDFDAFRKSLAIFASPLFGKIYYFDILVEEKVVIDQSFEIRDLIYGEKMIHKYLLLILSGERIRFFLGDSSGLIRLSTGIPDHIAAYKNDIPEKVSNFSDPSYRKEVLLDKLMKHADQALDLLLKTYPLQVFVMGTERTIGHFRKVSHHINDIIGYISGNYESATEAVLLEALTPHIAEWLEKSRWPAIRTSLDNAMSAKKLVTGVHEVWKAAAQNRGQLLLVEKNYRYAARFEANTDEIFDADITSGSSLFIKDAVDDIIEKVLHSGGDVEFVNEGLLKDFGRIALIEYY